MHLLVVVFWFIDFLFVWKCQKIITKINLHIWIRSTPIRPLVFFHNVADRKTNKPDRKHNLIIWRLLHSMKIYIKICDTENIPIVTLDKLEPKSQKLYSYIYLINSIFSPMFLCGFLCLCDSWLRCYFAKWETVWIDDHECYIFWPLQTVCFWFRCISIRGVWMNTKIRNHLNVMSEARGGWTDLYLDFRL